MTEQIDVRNEYKDGQALLYWYRVIVNTEPVRHVDVRELVQFIVTNQLHDIVPPEDREQVTTAKLFDSLLNDPAACAWCTHKIYTVDEFFDMCNACRVRHVRHLITDLPGDKQQRLAWIAKQPLA